MAAEPSSRKPKSSNARRTSNKQRRYQHLLDVNVRSDEAVRQRKRRLFSIVSKVLLGLGLITGIYFGATKAVAFLLLKNPDYNVADLNVETDGVLPTDVVLQAADLHKGEKHLLVEPQSGHRAGRSDSRGAESSDHAPVTPPHHHTNHRTQTNRLDNYRARPPRREMMMLTLKTHISSMRRVFCCNREKSLPKIIICHLSAAILAARSRRGKKQEAKKFTPRST